MTKTALDLTSEELRHYNPAKRIDPQFADEHWQKAWELVPRLVTLLKEQFAAERVVVFGSLTDKNRYTPWSDIDLAVWGIEPKRFYVAVGVLNEVSSDFKVDLVDPTDPFCRSSVKQAIEQTGVVV
ncbi:nucleotidyltransferase family protein [Leptolyngbya sp. AN03gr2]|uniref:nucleotidyltransferase family protein n=1 Tax=unclassified Leptolyngbya TaxID=2650499 RepID=UPI003D3196D4